MKKLPTYELLVVELQATLEALIKYSKSDFVKESAKKGNVKSNKSKRIEAGFILPKSLLKDTPDFGSNTDVGNTACVRQYGLLFPMGLF